MKYQRVKLSLKSKVVSASVFVVLNVFLASCSSISKNLEETHNEAREGYEVQKPIVVKSSDNDSRPEWTKKPSFEKDGHIYFSGGFLNGADYSVTIRCADAEALKVAAQSISQFIRDEFSEYARGSNTGTGGVERHVDDGIATFTQNLHLQGVRQKEVYYEETFSVQAMHLRYNAFVMLEMTKADYLKAKSDALRQLRNRFSRSGEIEAKEKAEKLLDELKEELGAASGHGV